MYVRLIQEWMMLTSGYKEPGQKKTVGKPHENVDLQDIGIKVKDTTVCHPKFLYYWFELLYMQGNMARLAEGQSIKSLSIKTIANIEIQVQQ
jgi:hypothetical protein